MLGVVAALTLSTLAHLAYRRTCCSCSPWGTTRHQLTNVRQALDYYMLENGSCPASLRELSGQWLAPTRLIDRWGTELIYRCSGDNVRLASAGPDRLQDTEDDIRLVSLLVGPPPQAER